MDRLVSRLKRRAERRQRAEHVRTYPSVIDLIDRAKTVDEVHRILGDHLTDRCSRRSSRRKNAAAQARIGQLRADGLVGGIVKPA